MKTSKEDKRKALCAELERWRSTTLHSLYGKPTLGQALDAVTHDYRNLALSLQGYMETTSCPACCASEEGTSGCLYHEAKRLVDLDDYKIVRGEWIKQQRTRAVDETERPESRAKQLNSKPG